MKSPSKSKPAVTDGAPADTPAAPELEAAAVAPVEAPPAPEPAPEPAAAPIPTTFKMSVAPVEGVVRIVANPAPGAVRYITGVRDGGDLLACDALENAPPISRLAAEKLLPLARKVFPDAHIAEYLE